MSRFEWEDEGEVTLERPDGDGPDANPDDRSRRADELRFNPHQPRAQDGKWTTGGGVYSGAPGDHITNDELNALGNTVRELGAGRGKDWEFVADEPATKGERTRLAKAEAKDRHLVRETIAPKVREAESGGVTAHHAGDHLAAETVPDPSGQGAVSRQYHDTPGSYTDYPHATREKALADSRAWAEAKAESAARTDTRYHTPKDLDRFFATEADSGAASFINDAATHRTTFTLIYGEARA